MDQNKLSEYKGKLEKERLLLLEEIKQSEKPASFGDDIDHFEEDTEATEDLGNHLAMAQDLKKRLDEIDVALSKIRNGGYGVCEKCGKAIGDDVLSLSPEAPRCKSCQA
jgi:DnaK suppressor protein